MSEEQRLLRQAARALEDVLTAHRVTVQRNAPDTVMQAEAQLDRIRSGAQFAQETLTAITAWNRRAPAQATVSDAEIREMICLYTGITQRQFPDEYKEIRELCGAILNAQGAEAVQAASDGSFCIALHSDGTQTDMTDYMKGCEAAMRHISTPSTHSPDASSGGGIDGSDKL